MIVSSGVTENDPILLWIVTKSMMLGLCGRSNLKSTVMNDNHQCTKRYPRDFSRLTMTDINGYSILTAIEGGRTAISDGRQDRIIDKR